MAERLTTRFHGILVKEADVSKIQVITKLGQLEDIMEKYGIESVEELEQELKIAHEIERLKDKNIDLNNAIIVFNKNFIKDYIREIEELKVVSDTWKRACELACEKLADIYSHCEYELFGDSVDEYRKYCEENGNPLQNIRYCETKYFYQQAKKEKENE